MLTHSCLFNLCMSRLWSLVSICFEQCHDKTMHVKGIVVKANCVNCMHMQWLPWLQGLWSCCMYT